MNEDTIDRIYRWFPNTKDVSTVSGSEADLFTTFIRPQTPPSWEAVAPAITIEDYIDTIVDEKLKKLLQEKEVTLQFKKVKGAIARKEVTDFILEKGKKGITQLSVLDISISLKLPAWQVEKIMDSFSKKRLIKEIYG